MTFIISIDPPTFAFFLHCRWSTVEVVTVSGSEYSKSLREHFLRVVEDGGDRIFVCQASDNE